MRASSLPRTNINNYETLTLDAYNGYNDFSNPRIVSTKRGITNKNLEQNLIAPYNPQQVLRTEPDRQDISTNLNFLSHQGAQNVKNSRMGPRPPGNWEEFMTKQVDVAMSMEQQRIKEEKIRAQKYRETLEKMIQNEQKKKVEMKREIMSPIHNFSELDALTQLEKLKQQEDRKYYSNQLKQLVMFKNEQKNLEEKKRQQEELRLKSTMDQLKQYEEFKKSLKNADYKPSFQDFQRMIEQNQKGQKEDQPNNYKSVNNTINKNQLEAFNGVENDKKKQIEEFINESVRKKVEQDALEMMKREEALKRLQTETVSTNYNKLQEKLQQSQLEKRARQQEYELFSQNQQLLDQIDNLKKAQEMKQRREYIDTLKYQTQTRKEAELQANSLSTAEKAMNFRRKENRLLRIQKMKVV